MSVSQIATIEASIDALPTDLADIASRWFERISALQQTDRLEEKVIAQLARVVACSDFAANTLLREWQWFVENQDRIDEVPDPDEVEAFTSRMQQADVEIDAAKEQLRRFRHRFLLRILWREISGSATLDQTVAGLSHLADRQLDAAAEIASRLLLDRYGVVRDAHGEPVSIVILGMGKLGGNELNFSSDIDLIFLFPSAGESDGAKCLSAQEYFTRMSRHIIALLDEVTADGFAFRIDTRLRPFGESGPPVVGFAALESYLLQHGRDWERYAYVKARVVGPQPPRPVADALRKDLIGPFVYRRYLDFGVFESLRKMHGLIAAEVQRREMADNIKLGPGGIREIEFIVQSLQLVRGGSRPELQEHGLLQVLPKLVGRDGMKPSDADELRGAYIFLRRLENFIQAIRDQQLHDLPTSEIDRARLCLAMRYSDWGALLEALDAHRGNVTRQFEAIAFRGHDATANDGLRQRLAELWERNADAAEWAQLLTADGFTNAQDIAECAVAFSTAPATAQLGSIARRRLRQFMPNLLLLIRDCKEPLVALRRIVGVIEKILRRSAYLALLNENEMVMERLVRLCERSSYIAEQLARYPVLLDELLEPRVDSTPILKAEFDAELEHRVAHVSADDSETQMTILGEFQRASMFRVAVADFTGNLPIMKVSDSLTFLAETVLGYALGIAWSDMTDKHGVPEYIVDGERHEAGFGIIGYGKLGGLELSYGSDLDLVFLHDSCGTQQRTSGERQLENSTFFTRLVRRLVLFLTSQTGSGMLYELDMRLRPDGQSGVMVSSLEAFERYQEDNAWTWEHQALLRARPVAGSARIAREFERIRAETLSYRVRRETLVNDVIDMRRRMRAKLDKSDTLLFDLKQGAGGIADIEFIVQFLVLANAGQHPGLFFYSDNIRQLEALATAGYLSAATSSRLQQIYKSYRLSQHHLVLDEKKPLLPQGEFTAEREYVRELWARILGADMK